MTEGGHDSQSSHLDRRPWPPGIGRSRAATASVDAQIGAPNSGVRHCDDEHTKRRVGVVGPELCDPEGRFDPEREDPGRTVPWPEPSVASRQVRRTR
jgi:hypothetical protein